MSWFKNPLDFAEGLLDQVDKRVSSVVGPSSHDGDSEAPAGHATSTGMCCIVRVRVVCMFTTDNLRDSAGELRCTVVQMQNR